MPQSASNRRRARGGANARRQRAAAGPHAARLARSSGGARSPAGGQARHRSSLRAGGLCQASRRPRATLFPRPGGHAIPVVSGLVSDRGWMAEAMGVEPAEVLARFQEAALNPIPWQEVASAPAQEVVHRAGRSRASAAAADPQRARRRPLYHGRPHDRAQSEHRKAERLDPSLPVHRAQPARRAAAAAPRPHVLRDGRGGRAAARSRHRHRRRSADACSPRRRSCRSIIDELEIAGALHGRPLPVVKCLTSEFRVPAEAEIVIEGRFLPGVREAGRTVRRISAISTASAPTAEVMEVVAVTHRKDAIFHTIVGGGLEHLLLGAIPNEATLLAHLRRIFPNVLDVHLARRHDAASTSMSRSRSARREKPRTSCLAPSPVIRSQACHRRRRGRRHPQSDRGRMGGGDPLPGRPRSGHRAGSQGPSSIRPSATASARRWASTPPSRFRRTR